MPMKTLFAASTALFTMTAVANNSAQTSTPAGEPESAKVISVVSSIPLAVDLAAYDLAERAFASKVEIDYTSLWGGTPNSMTPGELMTAWRGIVPGFDATWHQLGPVSATINGNQAKATAHVDGRHWIDGKLWRPIGNYHWDLSKINGEWKVTRMEFAMSEEIGDRALAAQAMERAKLKAK
jgi:hypothetical protein